MQDLLILTHSVLRYFVLVFLVIVIVRTFLGWQKKAEFTALDDKMSLWLFIFTHTQLLFGLILYVTSPRVIFSGTSMKDSLDRYWLVEHISMKLIAVVLISMATITAKKRSEATAKYRRLFIFNAIALIIVVVTIVLMTKADPSKSFFSLPI